MGGDADHKLTVYKGWAMDKAVEDQLVSIVQDLVAEGRALRVIVGLLLADNPSALLRLKEMALAAEEFTLPLPLSERQRSHLRDTLAQVAAGVEADRNR